MSAALYGFASPTAVRKRNCVSHASCGVEVPSKLALVGSRRSDLSQIGCQAAVILPLELTTTSVNMV